jgi:5-methylthioribose kinase
LRALDDTTLPEYFRTLGLLPADEPLSVEPAGEGNINYVRRVRAGGGRSWIVKHARPYLERFPEYRVTPERIVFEHRYGLEVRRLAPVVAGVLPREVRFDAERFVIVMEDLGHCSPLDRDLAAGKADPSLLHRLGAFLGTVHRSTAPEARALVASFANDEMRRLHGEHIFTLPYEPNDFPIPEAVRRAGARLLERAGMRERIRGLRDQYYGRADGLVHGDVQAGNVLVEGRSPRLLDAEIAHVGDPAFDLGTALAHVAFHRVGQPAALVMDDSWQALEQGYAGGAGSSDEIPRARQYAGVEMLRRTLGAARVPWVASEAVALDVLELAGGLLAS